MDSSQLFFSLLDSEERSRLTVVRQAGYSYVKVLTLPMWGPIFSRAPEPDEKYERFERLEAPLVGLVADSLPDLVDLFRVWSKVVPVTAIPEQCVHRTPAGSYQLVVYIYGPFQRHGRQLWTRLKKKMRKMRGR